MRLEKYLQYSSVDKDTNKYKSLEIRMLNKDTDYDSVVEKIEKQYKLNTSILGHIDKLNKELKKSYNGKWKFQLCLDEGKMPDEIIKNKRSGILKRKMFKLNEKLSNMKLEIENK